MNGQPTIAYTVDQAAEKLGVCRHTIERSIARGELRGAKKIGRRWLIPRAAVDRYGEIEEEVAS